MSIARHTTAANTLTTYCYNASQPHTLATTLTATTSCTGAAATYHYDKTGNTTGRPDGSATQTLTWDAEGRLGNLQEKSGATVTGSTDYLSDASGALLIRRNAAGETVLYLDGSTEIHVDATSVPAKTWGQRAYPFAGQVVATRTTKAGAPPLTWTAGDQHGTSSLAVNATDQSTIKRYATPFGASRPGGTGTWPNDKNFLGAPADTGTGLTHLGAREYDPAIGRFLSVDPILDGSDDQSLNGYTYADNNPATLTDPTGQRSECGQNGDSPCSTDASPSGGGSADNYHCADTDICTGSSGSGGSSSGGGTAGGNHSAGGSSTAPAGCDANCQKMMEVWKCGILGCGATENFGRWCQHNDILCSALAHGPEFNRLAGQALHLEQEFLGIADFADCRNGDIGACASLASNATLQSKLALYSRAADALSEMTGGSFDFGCSFTPDTPVLMDDAKTKAIGDIQPGDRVEAADPDTGKHRGPRTVTATHINHDDDLVDLTVETSPGHTSTLHTTSKHPFWDDTLHTWIPAGRLTPGHALETATNHHTRITAVRTVPGSADMYNLTIDQLHTYYVLAGTTPILVHNSDCVSAPAANIDPDTLTMTKTVENHFNDITKQGLPARPFMNSTQVVREVMGGSEPTLDPRGAAGALRWDTPGALNGKEGTWELVVDTNTNTILHFNFVR